jgi:pimeloyl-ACP methyl ester carboxylesterase
MATPHPLVGRGGLPRRRRLTILLAAGLLGAAALVGAGLASGFLGGSPAPEDAPAVILAHGLGRTPASMAILANRLEEAGFRVVRFGYPSRSEPIETLVDRLRDEVERCCGDAPRRVHFVTHSMGGVLVRRYLSERPEPHEGRVVMLSPPNQGSEIVDAFADSELLRSFLGPAGARLGTTPNGIASQLPPVRFSLGIITGSRSMNPIGSWLIPGPDDGTVGVDRAKVEGASFLVLPATHTFIMNRRDVAEEVVHFLQHGRFRREST